MTQDEWIKIAFGLAGGGLVGSLITNLWTEWRNRITPIAYRIENDRLFTPTQEFSTLQVSITVLHDNEPYSFNNLFIAQVELINRGNKDLDKLTYGISLDGAKKIIFAETEGQDRHHVMTPAEVACPSTPLTKMDFTCQPFHRGNIYRLKLYVVSLEGDAQPADIKLSSPDPIRFVEAPSMGEILQETLLGTAIAVGPFRVSIR
ncbi:hypothetical protein NUACC21_79860 [Scytonema sp. NUACC21]